MSITFWAPDAPTHTVTPYPDEPDYQEQRSDLPEINLSNTNACAMMRALGVPAEPDGTWAVSELPELLRRAMALANVEELRGPVTAATVESGGELRPGRTTGNVHELHRTCKVISHGRTDEYVQSTALRFVELFKAAKDGSFSVCWG